MARPYAKHQTVSRPDAQSDVHTSYHDKRRKPFVILKKTQLPNNNGVTTVIKTMNPTLEVRLSVEIKKTDLVVSLVFNVVTNKCEEY